MVEAVEDMRERAWLARLCTRLTGAAEAADELAQETLIEAWRHAERLDDPARREPWLAGIARNVCLRWWRAQSKNAARFSSGEPDEAIPGKADIEDTLERRDLMELLDRALA